MLENESVSLLFPNNSILQIAPPKWQPLRNPTTALRESESDGIEESSASNYALIRNVYGEDEDVKNAQLLEAVSGGNDLMKDADEYFGGTKGEDAHNNIYDKLMETMSGRLPMGNSTAPDNTTTTAAAAAATAEVLDDLAEGLPRDWSGYLQSVKTDNFN